MKPMPKITVPILIMMRGPNRSASQPWTGPRMPLSMRVRANAKPRTVLLQPKSACSSTT